MDAVREEAGKRVLEALERERPQGFLYAVCPLPYGETFVTLTVTDDGIRQSVVGLAGISGIRRELQDLGS